MRIIPGCFVLFLAIGGTVPVSATQSAQSGGVSPHQPAPTDARPQKKTADPAKLFQQGQDHLNAGKLDAAEHDFRGVLALDSKSGAAYANLGVVYMRRKQWSRALEMLEKAEKLMPQVAGIRLNEGLAYYRQNEFLKAIPPFESVVRDQPDALQPRYLLGLCYFFAERWSDATATLEPLWTQESGEFPYLYVLSNAAHRAGQKELDDRAAEQLIKLSNGSPEYHLFAGKYYLNLGQLDPALTEFQAAAEANPNLPFVHFNLGLTYEKKQEYGHARDEFLKDAAVEPDLGLDYEELGNVYWLMQDDDNAEISYHDALRRDPRLVNSRIGLAKVYQRQGKYPNALTELDAAERIDRDRPDIHYLRARLLLRLARADDAKKELAAAHQIESRHQAAGHAPAADSVPSPELLQDPQ
jgi:tetratricopeptide (TPR) repeat protein